MCLTALHKEAYIAEQPILVYKILNDDGLFSKLTPYMGFKIKFRFGRSSELTTTIVKHVYSDGKNRFVEIKNGFHAFCKKESAEFTAFGLNEDYLDSAKVYYAVIPKDAKYYIGDRYDIVSDRQIIFRTERAFKRSKYANCKPYYDLIYGK